MPPELADILHSCIRRIDTWHTPPNRSSRDWTEEMRAHGAAAAWQALYDYDPAYGVPLGAFVRQRVMACAFTYYRQEWAFARRCVSEAEEHLSVADCDSIFSPAVQELLQYALAWLSESDRRLIDQLFWKGHTETEIAQQLRLSQRAVSKRKEAVLQKMRRLLGTAEKVKT